MAVVLHLEPAVEDLRLWLDVVALRLLVLVSLEEEEVVVLHLLDPDEFGQTGGGEVD